MHTHIRAYARTNKMYTRCWMIYTFVDTLLGFRDSRKFENLWETRKINVPSVRRVTSYVTLTFKFKFKDNEINEKTE